MAEAKKSINYQDMQNMGPVEKYEKYDRFPFKLVIHILLVIFTTFQVVLIVAEANKYSRAQERFLYNMLIDEDDKRSVDFNKQAYLYTPEDVKNHVSKSVHNFYRLKSKSLEIVEFTTIDPKIHLEFSYIDNEKIRNTLNNKVDEVSSIPNDISLSPFIKTQLNKKFDYLISNATLGPFDNSEDYVKEFLNDVTEFRMNFTLKTYVPYFYNNNYDCNLWKISQNYNFATRAHFTVKLNIVRLACEDYTGDHSYTDIFINKLLWVHLVVVVLALISLVLTWNYISSTAGMYMKVKSKHKQKLKGEDENAVYTKSEDSIYYNPLLDEKLFEEAEKNGNKERFHHANTINYPDDNCEGKEPYIPYMQNMNLMKEIQNKPHHHKKQSQMFNKWSLICLCGNIVQIFGASISIFDKINILPSAEILVGFGCMLAFLNIGRYIEYAENYSTIFVTIKSSLPNVMRYLLGVTPIFLGFLFFGLCIFWRSERFTNTSNVMVVLFSLAQGDSVFDVFKDLSGFYFFIGQIYLYFFCIIFIVVVLNIFIAIIEEAYVKSKMQNKTHWAFDYIKKDSKQTLQFNPGLETKREEEKETKSFTSDFDENNKSLIRKKNRKSNNRSYSNSNKILPIVTKGILKTAQTHKIYSNQKVTVSPPVKTEEEFLIECRKKMEEEFTCIEEEMKAILQMSLEIKIYGDDHLVDEIRMNILDRINSSILNKTEDIKSQVNEWK